MPHLATVPRNEGRGVQSRNLEREQQQLPWLAFPVVFPGEIRTRYSASRTTRPASAILKTPASRKSFLGMPRARTYTRSLPKVHTMWAENGSERTSLKAKPEWDKPWTTRSGTATHGVYSGVVANGNGDSSDETNINNTFLRGIQKTDSDGVPSLTRCFPGTYTGRATHIHVMVHTNATELSNQTLGNQVYASHVGQAFFDQDLITAVEKVEPYASNSQPFTQNSDDSILTEEADTD
ncbi:hypothetical protein J3458_021787 [Metarhizium acridum]|uniref:uncharacterized protein n=1 Tax=Metarhizium acridum TaxID=92637 RepID=UPI001C6B8B3E|nr:hypothetical protein J3458_021787 [Metarhizium acridum]